MFSYCHSYKWFLLSIGMQDPVATRPLRQFLLPAWEMLKAMDSFYREGMMDADS